jgi:hypothetical protein
MLKFSSDDHFQPASFTKMTLHAFIEYLKYRWRAKSRHGVHSPFVYDLVEHVLLEKGNIDWAYIIEYRSLPLSYENLASRLAAYYGYRAIVFLPGKSGAIIPSQVDMLLLDRSIHPKWGAMLEEHFPLLNNEGVVLATDIHRTRAHTTAWKKLCTDPKVRVSIDLYGIGLLFFNQQFKVPQHFTLKY